MIDNSKQNNITFYVVDELLYNTKYKNNSIYLVKDNWDDYDFKTLFKVYFIDEKYNKNFLGETKIGFRKQNSSERTYDKINKKFYKLSEEYFSFGSDVNYYNNMILFLQDNYRNANEFINVLLRLRDVTIDDDAFRKAEYQNVFEKSLTRTASVKIIRKHLENIIENKPIHSDFLFNFSIKNEERYEIENFSFEVIADSKPPTNIHAIIGRNGSGKTTLLSAITRHLVKDDFSKSIFKIEHKFFDPHNKEKLHENYNFFSRFIAVSFSVFDPFIFPQEDYHHRPPQPYLYIGLKKNTDSEKNSLKSLEEIHNEFSNAIKVCFSESQRKKRWEEAISILESDNNFKELNVKNLANLNYDNVAGEAKHIIKKTSSGHAISLLIITKLVACVEERSLVLMDEPESHLHPPLLSAFIRCIGSILRQRNAIAIIATHSPVILQEVPKSCVWKIKRSGSAISASRPEQETFGENVGSLTRDVFGLEVSKSGFISLLNEEVDKGKSYDEIINDFKGQLGFEGKIILQSLLSNREVKK